ncbi:MAG: lipopolysaccharide heptosyltransferase II [Verrucomicrobia bacterium]|nr:lipopolysaccharide heptosyltransferase II [Verrucomicrobiota bacterium]
MHITDLFPLGGKLLICGPNWLGDSVMSFPAIQVLKRKLPECRITVLVKPGVAPLWRMHSGVDKVIELNEGLPGTIASAMDIKERQPDLAFVFPNSFRSALIPFLGRVPVRVGARGHSRSWMLTKVVDTAPEDLLHRHQAWEYFKIVGLTSEDGKGEKPKVQAPKAVIDDVKASFRIDPGISWIGLIPGAAHGPSKRWPADYFAEAGGSLSSAYGCGILVFGTASEREVCERICSKIGGKALNLAGRTSIPDLVVLLGLCRTVVTNDCGGMHLAAMGGVRVVAVFGVTDPVRTGPIGDDHAIVLAEGFEHSRDVPSDSPEARDAMQSIVPERVVNAARKILEGGN